MTQQKREGLLAMKDVLKLLAAVSAVTYAAQTLVIGLVHGMILADNVKIALWLGIALVIWRRIGRVVFGMAVFGLVIITGQTYFYHAAVSAGVVKPAWWGFIFSLIPIVLMTVALAIYWAMEKSGKFKHSTV